MRLLFRLVVALSLLALPGATLARSILAAVPISRMDLPWWHARFEAKQAELREKHPKLIFLGDSITQNWERQGPPDWADYAPVWQRFYGDRDAVDLGFNGDTTASLIWRIRNGELEGIAPKVAVVLIGANNLGRVHWSAEDTVAGIDTIIAELHRRLPHTKVLLLGVLPSDRTAWATETTVAINRTLAAKYAHAGFVTFLDVGSRVAARRQAGPRAVLRSEADPTGGAAASHRAGHGAAGRGDGADARHAARRPQPSGPPYAITP